MQFKLLAQAFQTEHAIGGVLCIIRRFWRNGDDLRQQQARLHQSMH